VLPLDDPDFVLRWPKDVFFAELRDALEQPEQRTALLLREAFAGPRPADRAEYNAAAVLRELAQRREELRSETDRAPYRIERLRAVAADDSPRDPDWALAQRQFGALFRSFEDNGYLDFAWGKDCVDDPRAAGVADDAFRSALGEDVSPYAIELAGPDVFLSVVEVAHDLVARPRSVERVHSYGRCGTHYADFSRASGQRLFRARVNEILARAHIPFRLADSGEDRGRVVVVSDDAREDLLTRALGDGPSGARNTVEHAIALFRARGAGRDEKRSAVVALARILEEHRSTLKSELLSKDEGALFQIANGFDVRHNDGKQATDYDDAFLDWVFWWYLGTIELIGRLEQRQATAAT
jgi:hypothetical protein